MSLGRPEPWNCFEDLSMSEMEKKVGRIRITTDIYMVEMIGNTGASTQAIEALESSGI